MPRVLFVTMGEFAGRYMRLDDDMAGRALADGWARETEQDPEADPDNPNPVGDPNEEPPESLDEFENPEPEPTVGEGEADNDGEPASTKRRSKPSPRRRSQR